MYFTWPFIITLVVLAIAAIAFPVGWFIFVTFLILLLLWGIDLWLVWRDTLPTVVRDYPVPVYQNVPATLSLSVTNPLSRTVYLAIKDEPPFAVTTGDCYRKMKLFPGQTVEFQYSLLSSKRGSFPFGDVNLRITGRLGLFCSRTKYPLPGELKVYPNLTRILENKSNSSGSELEGIHRRRTPGLGGELAQLRKYATGDDYRMVNWKVSARQGQMIVNEFEPEKDQNVFLLFDTGRLLFDQATQSDSRLDAILDSAILLAYNVLEYGDMVGALSFNYKVGRYLPVGKGHHHLQLLINQFFDLQAEMVESDYREAFRFWQNKTNKRCLLFVYTDIIDGEASKELLNHLQLLSRHHRVVCVLSRPNSLYQLSESPIIDERSAYLKGTALEMISARESLKKVLLNQGIKILEVDTSNIQRSVMQHYLYLKHQGLF
jgi:uncharacterized protein (DUF58 family)